MRVGVPVFSALAAEALLLTEISSRIARSARVGHDQAPPARGATTLPSQRCGRLVPESPCN